MTDYADVYEDAIATITAYLHNRVDHLGDSENMGDLDDILRLTVTPHDPAAMTGALLHISVWSIAKLSDDLDRDPRDAWQEIVTMLRERRDSGPHDQG